MRRLDWLKYHIDFFTFPALVTATVFLDRGTLIGNPLAWLTAFALGFVLWTFVEYWVHRVVLHRFFWHGTHERHHKHPQEHVLFPLWYVPGGFAILYAIAYAISYVTPFAFGGFGGFALGYVWFMVMHHWLHHIDLRPHTWLHRYAIWHNRHHKLTAMNYGITTNVWDRVFGTSR